MKKLLTLVAAQAVMLTIPMAAHADVQADPTVSPAPQVAPVAAPQITLAPRSNLPFSGTGMHGAGAGPTIEPVFRLPVRPDLPSLTLPR